MDEILFRGKPKDQEHFYFFSQCWKENCKDGFVYGSLVVDKDRCFIVVSALCSNRSVINNGTTSMIEVIPETVGQFTGLTDRNDKKIFEGDIVTMPSYGGGRHKSIVYFKKGKFAVDGSNYSFKDIAPKNMEIIGNIHDNPELLKEGADNG